MTTGARAPGQQERTGGGAMRVLAWPARANAARNPFQSLLYGALEGQGGAEVAEFSMRGLLARPAPEIWHLHWPDVFLAAGKGWRFWPRLLALRGAMALARVRGIKVVWTAHNLRRAEQQNGARLERWFWPWFLGRIDGVIFMTEASAAQARAEAPALARKLAAVIPHGSYAPVIGALSPAPVEPGSAPQAILFGSISRYKNVWKLLEAFLEIPAGRARLRISGKMSLTIPDERLLDLLAKVPQARAGEVVFEDRFIPDAELLEAIRAADLVVLPYADVLNSGVAIYALSAGRPILASDAALFRELQGQVGGDWVRLIAGELDGAQLEAALSAARALRLRAAVPDMSAFDWTRIAQSTAAFYRAVLAGDGAK